MSIDVLLGDNSYPQKGVSGFPKLEPMFCALQYFRLALDPLSVNLSAKFGSFVLEADLRSCVHVRLLQLVTPPSWVQQAHLLHHRELRSRHSG